MKLEDTSELAIKLINQMSKEGYKPAEILSVGMMISSIAQSYISAQSILSTQVQVAHKILENIGKDKS